jgi:polysaccharide export outer membrane protein
MIKKSIGCLVGIILLSACGSLKDVVYLQDVTPLKKQKIGQKYEAVIHQDDLLSIFVSCETQELAAPFNMPAISTQIGSETNTSHRILGYLVDVEGNIDFPLFGKIPVVGLTRMELINLLKGLLIKDGQIKDPRITIQFLNFKVSVMGEVNRPGSFTITGDRITLLEALSMAGDLTIYGKRDRVAVIREEEGRRVTLFHDLRSADVFESPCYYLQQNDIIYVEPNNARAGQSNINQNNSVGVWLSAISLLASVTALIINLSRN